MQEYFEVGQIVNTFGIKGQLKVKPFTDDINRFEELKTVYICKKNEMKKVEIEDVKYNKQCVLLKIKGIENLTEAEKYKGLFLKIDRMDAKKLPKDTYFIADILGLEVYTEEGELLGKVDDIFPTGANDVYVIKDEMRKTIIIAKYSRSIKTN